MCVSFIYTFKRFVKSYWIHIILVILSLYDLRIEFRILHDSFTFASLSYTIKENPLPIAVLLLVNILPKIKQ